MTNVDIVQRFNTAVEKGDPKALDNILADRFQFRHAAMPEAPADKQQFIDMVTSLHKALPDIRFNPSDIKESNPVKGTVQITGTHTGPLHFPPLTEEPVEATNKKVNMPVEPSTWTIENDKIVRYEVEKVPGGGVIGMLEQVGAPVARIH